MGNTSYAQNFEDVMLWRALGSISNGRYIDIGAQDPLVDSVSLHFYQQGWRGVHVEPTPHYAEKLRQARTDEIIIQAAVTDKHGVVNFFEIPDTGLSTTDRQIAEQHIRDGFGVREIMVAGVTLDDVLSQESSEEVHWLKIDVEGGELEVIKGWDRSTIRPWIVLIESTLPLSQIESYEQWEFLILRKGYTFAYFDGLNRFYVADGHADLLNAFSSGPNVFDHFELSGSASSDLCSGLNSRIRLLEEGYVRASNEAEASNESWRVENSKLRKTLADSEIEFKERLRRLEGEISSQLRYVASREQEHSDQIAAVHAAAANQAKEHQELLASRDSIVSELRDSQGKMERALERLSNRERELTVAVQQAKEHAQSRNRELSEVRAESARLYRELTQRLGEKDALADTLRKDSLLMRERHDTQISVYLDQLAITRDLLFKVSLDSDHRGFRSYMHARFANATTHTSDDLILQTREHLNKVSKIIMNAPSFIRANYQPPFIVNPNGAYRLEEFLLHYDLSFVRVAYAAILRREPDPKGQAHYLYQVRAGEHRAKILGQILQSEEAQKFKTQIQGLSTYLKILRLSELPVIGQIVAAFIFLASVNGHLRDLRVLENHTIRIAEEAQRVNESNLDKLRSQIK